MRRNFIKRRPETISACFGAAYIVKFLDMRLNGRYPNAYTEHGGLHRTNLFTY
ncbi:hypothetical protein SRABI96_03773 [Peribacillus sp. Bi96]|nr:hypothetical protein SRABI96_03773 [Peribacillus sp. Bi96]